MVFPRPLEKCAPSRVDGIDPSDAQVDFAQNRNLAVPVNFRIGDAMALPYATDSFDVGMLDLILSFLEIISFTKHIYYYRCDGISYIFCT